MKQETQDRYGLKAIFTQQDKELLAAYRRIQKFRMRKNKDIKAGWVINIRETHALDNAWVEVMRVDGRPRKDTSPNCRFWIIDQLKQREYSADYIHCATLIDYNHGYKLNAKTQAFGEMLKRADRFQQYCILTESPYTQETFNDWREHMQWNKHSDETRDGWYDQY